MKCEASVFKVIHSAEHLQKDQFLGVNNANLVWMEEKQTGKDGFSCLTSSVWTWFHPEEVQAESLNSTGAVNQVAKLHYLQQHDNPFST